MPRRNSRIAPLNLVGTRSTASPYFRKVWDAVERVPTTPRRFMGRGVQSILLLLIRNWSYLLFNIFQNGSKSIAEPSSSSFTMESICAGTGWLFLC